MKKLLATLLASTMALTTIGGLVACGGDNGGAKKVKEVTPDNFGIVTNLDDPLSHKDGYNNDKVAECTLTLWAPSIANELFTSLINEFTTTYRDGKYSNVTIDIENKDESDVKTALGTDSEGAADVYFYAGDHTGEMIRNNWLLPLRGATGSFYSAAIAQRDDKGAGELVCKDGYYYAFPATNDNGYYLVYNTDDLTEEEADDLDTILEKAADPEIDKNFLWPFGTGFFAGTFFFGTGCKPVWDGINSDFSDFAATSEKAQLGAQATIKYVTNSKLTNTAGSGIADAVMSGEMIAGICGTWENPTKEQLESGKIGCKKLPMFTVTEDNTGTKYQMGGFYGGKYCGVNPSTKNAAVAMALANFLTNSKAQQKRADMYGTGPSNLTAAESDAVKNNIPLAAYLAQGEACGVFQGDVPQAFWDAMEAYTGDAFSGKNTLAELNLEDMYTLLTTKPTV